MQQVEAPCLVTKYAPYDANNNPASS